MLTSIALLASLASVPQGTTDGDLWERLSFYANGRLRAESTFDQPPNGIDRHRGRLRFRAGAKYVLAEGLRAEARISTASSSPNNAHWDFGNSFHGADLVLDRFYVDWDATDDVSIRAGKMPHAFATPPVYGEWIWDADIQPAGVAAVWTPDLRSTIRADLRVAEYIAVENSQDNDPKMFGLQGNVHVPVGNDANLHLSTSYLNWSTLGAGEGFAVATKGNTLNMGGMNIWEAFLALSIPRGPLGRTQYYIEVMNNTDADDAEDTGLALGARFGGAGKRGDMNVFGSWYSIDANAILGTVSQDDTPIDGTGTGTGMTGIIAGAQYFWRDHVTLKLWALTSAADVTEDTFRVRFDLDFKVQ